MSETNKLRIWHIPQIPMKPFLVEVPDLQSAGILLDSLAYYDIFQFENNIKPDYCNASGLGIFEDGQWTDWHDEETGMDFDEWWESNKPESFKIVKEDE